MKKFQNIWPFIPCESQVWRKQFTQHDKLVIEIGAGAGLHAIQYASQHPNNFIIPIERTLVKSKKLIRRVENHPNLTNIYPVSGDAIPWICQHCFAEEVDHYFILYPNPYPKHSHANKRFINMPFMEKMFETLKPGGLITFATNMANYYVEVKRVAQERWPLTIIDAGLLPQSFKPRTNFEKKYLARGELCFQVILQK